MGVVVAASNSCREVSGLELLSMDMKRRGVFLSRSISFQSVAVQMKKLELFSDFQELYAKCCKLVSTIY